MITGLDHIVLICPDIAAGIATYETLLGRAPDWRAQASGAATALFRVDNTALELMAPTDESAVSQRLRTLLDTHGTGLTSLAFACDDIEAVHHKLTRRGLKPDDISGGESTDTLTGRRRTWRRFRCDDSQMAGIKTFILKPDSAIVAADAGPATVNALDHIVIDTPNPDRALGLYGARLGLDLALDRTRDEWKTRFLFFRTGGLTFEVIHRLGGTHDPQANDRIWGLTWTVEDLAAAHHRLSSAGCDVSEIRKGRKPGSAVFTVRDHTLGVPTLFISHSPR